ncbi:MAG TPA: amino acid permease, partial [Gemmatimonadaceae bacterium]|nr:amino acid permease [Gemmatimonadaceae bacterium]
TEARVSIFSRSMTELRRSIGLVRATAMVVGIIVGASIFVQPSAVTAQVPSVTAVLLVWTTAGLLTLIGSLVVAELASAFPRTGGVYVFLNEAYSPSVGFLWGWAMFWTMHSGIIAVIAMVFARYVGAFVPLGDGGILIVAVASIIALSAVNYLGVRLASALQVGLTCIKVLALVLIVAAAGNVARQGGDALRLVTGAAGTAMPAPGAFALALIAGLFAFGGWHMVSYAAEETVNPTRTIPRALVLGTLTVTALYVAVNGAYLSVLPLATVASSSRVAADFADAAVGGSGAQIMSALVVLSTLGAMNGVILAGPRVYLAMAGDGLLFKWAGAVHPRYRTPHRAIALQAVWSSVLVATGTYRALFTRVVYTEWVFFGLLAAALVVLRRRPGYAPEYRAWGYPILPALFVLSTATIVFNQIMHEPLDSLLGLGLVLAGLPVYYIWARKH